MATDLLHERAHVDRLPDLAAWSARKSLFLFGPRQTGKTTLIRRQLPRARIYDLLDSSVLLALGQQPGRFEVDFVLGDHTAIEVKAKANVAPRELRSLRALAEEKKLKRALCVSLEPRRRTLGGITILPWRQFLDALWGGEYSG